MLSPEFQADMPLKMFVFPLHPQATLPPEFTQFAPAPAQPATLPPAEIAANREKWIEAWTNAVLR
jgi:thiamine transport system substrate-binding protein